MGQEQIDEYIEAIFDIAEKDGTAKTTDVAKKLKNTPASVTEVFQNLATGGLVHYEPYKGVSLTQKGLEEAKKIKRKHRLLEVLLSKTLHVPCEKVHEEACRMEHSVSDEVGNAICRLLGAPCRCPGGQMIYPCNQAVETCNECEVIRGEHPVLRKENVVPLTELKPSQKGIISFIRGRRKVIQRLCDLGLTPRTEVVLIRKAPRGGPIELLVRRTNLAIGVEIADTIFVELS
jgi:DtxR family Mn-dependent transcriptional regulator